MTTQEVTLQDLITQVKSKPLPSYIQIFPIRVKPKGVVGVFGVSAVSSAIAFYLLAQDEVKYVATTESVMNTDKFKLAKDFVLYLENQGLTRIVLPDNVEPSNAREITVTFARIFQNYSMHTSGIPMELLSLIAPVSIGQKWIYNVQKNIFKIL